MAFGMDRCQFGRQQGQREGQGQNSRDGMAPIMVVAEQQQQQLGQSVLLLNRAVKVVRQLKYMLPFYIVARYRAVKLWYVLVTIRVHAGQ